MEKYWLTDRQKRIDDLEWFISRREDDRELRDFIVELKVLWIPSDLFDNIFVFDEIYSRFSEHEDPQVRSIFNDWIDSYLAVPLENKVKSIPKRVLENIEKTRISGRVLLMGDVSSDEAYKTLEDLQGIIRESSDIFSHPDEIIQGMKKEWANGFMKSLKEDFRHRRVLDDIEWITLQEQYDLLIKISLSKNLKDTILRRICAILPACPWQELDWWDIESIVTEIIDK